MSIHQLAVRWAACLARELGSSLKQESRMAFGLELLIGESIKLLIILLLSWLFGIFPEVLIVLTAAGVLRLVSGGEHCSEYYRCLIGGTICFLLLGWAAHILNSVITKSMLFLIPLSSCFLAAASLWKYAPGDTANKPITNTNEINKFKRLSLFVVCLYLFIMLLLARTNRLSFLVIPLALGMLEQVFTVTPGGYFFLHQIDHILAFGRRGEDDGETKHSSGR
ncbi:MAG TPA: accessory gene regulator B family protein [Syntrophomonadaceae bacterium]|nr:accessory gene regulator B family protein [Syntrophomonadaceae bacterium]